ncbi:MAG: hypothetical protein WCO51_05080 [bacterium]
MSKLKYQSGWLRLAGKVLLRHSLLKLIEFGFFVFMIVKYVTNIRRILSASEVTIGIGTNSFVYTGS